MAKTYYFIDRDFLISLITNKVRYLKTFCEGVDLSRQRFYYFVRKKHAVKDTVTLRKIAFGLHQLYPELSFDYWKKVVWKDFDPEERKGE